MKKDGFVFVESVVVLVVVALSLAMLISSYSLVSRKTKEKEKYDRTSDKYLVYVISKLGTDDVCNYSMGCSNLSNKDISFRADADPNSTKYSCATTKVGELVFNCNQVFADMGLVHLYVVDNVKNELNDLKSDGTRKDRNSDDIAVRKYDSGTLEYMKTLKKCNDANVENGGKYYNISNSTPCVDPIKYMIGVFERGNGNYYYASIEL